MAFVWSRLALAAVLAVGGATAAGASPAGGARCDEAPRLACCECAAECPSLIVELAEGGALGDLPLVAPAAVVVSAPPSAACDVTPPRPTAAPARARDVLRVAPKTSPPRS